MVTWNRHADNSLCVFVNGDFIWNVQVGYILALKRQKNHFLLLAELQN